jgi:hypothetical protein
MVKLNPYWYANVDTQGFGVYICPKENVFKIKSVLYILCMRCILNYIHMKPQTKKKLRNIWSKVKSGYKKLQSSKFIQNLNAIPSTKKKQKMENMFDVRFENVDF